MSSWSLPWLQPAPVALPDDPAAAAPAASWNPFARMVAAPLPAEAEPELSWAPELSRWDRLVVFAICLLGSAVCYATCGFLFPVLLLRPRKFAVLWLLGLVLFLVLFGVLHASVLAYLVHLASPARLPFSLTFVGSIVLTLTLALKWHSLLLLLVFALVQLVAVVAYTVSYFPGGRSTLRFAGGMASSMATNLVDGWLNA